MKSKNNEKVQNNEKLNNKEKLNNNENAQGNVKIQGKESQRGDILVNKWHSVYTFHLLFEDTVKMPELSVFLEALRTRFGEILPMSDTPHMPESASDMMGFGLMDHPVCFKDKKQEYPSQLLLFGADAFERGIWNEMICSQFWTCQDKEHFLPRCRYAMMASNMMAAGLPRMEEYGILAEYADMLLEVFPDCIGIYWPHSQCLTPREYYQQPHWNNPQYHFLDGGLNVRFFNIQGTDEMLFDTLGFTAIGLPDLQVHCKNLEPNDVVHFLRNLGAYLYECGDVIEDGNTVEGIHHEKWVCRREDSMVGPGRMVLDVNPGEYAGGNR